MFFKLACLYLAVSCVVAAPPTDVVPLERQQPTVIPIISQSEELESNGTYKYSYETGNGIKREETSYDKVIPKTKSEASSNEGGEYNDESNEIHVQQGSYSYTAPDGTVISVRYIADENGFQPIGDHLPKLQSAAPSSSQRRGKTVDSTASASSPAKPVNSVVAEAPKISVTPNAPQTPKAPEISQAPETAEAPKIPVASTASEGPKTSEEPKAPESPIVESRASETLADQVSTTEASSEPSTTEALSEASTTEVSSTEPASTTKDASSTTEQAEVTSTAALDQSTTSEASSTTESSTLEASSEPASTPAAEPPQAEPQEHVSTPGEELSTPAVSTVADPEPTNEAPSAPPA